MKARTYLGALVPGLLAAAFVAPGPVIPAAAPSPISIKQCFIIQRMMATHAGGTQIVFLNRSALPIKRVTFAVGYRNAAKSFIRRVTDVGSFAPGVVINHKYSLYSDVMYAGKQPTSCTVVAAWWENGTAWAL